MKNYNVQTVISEIGSKVQIQGKRIIVGSNVGIKTWGKIDFLKRNDYTIVFQ